MIWFLGRAFADFTLGLVIYYIACRFAKMIKRNKTIVLLAIAMLMLTGYMLLWDTAYSNKDFIILLVFAILIICCEIMNEKVKNGKIEQWLTANNTKPPKSCDKIKHKLALQFMKGWTEIGR